MAPVAASAEIASTDVAQWRDTLQRGRVELREAFRAGSDTTRLLRGHARLVDSTLRAIWLKSAMPRVVALVGVGGYGRGQLFPHSDVDVMLLVPDDPHAIRGTIERLLATLWDVGLEVGFAARTLDDCEREMASDATIRTSLLEHRLVAGSRRLYDEFERRFIDTLDVRAFFEAKALEQQQRHLKYHDAAYSLEPNVKENPGGLRDLQTVIWIARASGLGRTWKELAARGLITVEEAGAVNRNEHVIGGLRARLHYLAGRREDRLVFDLQTALASELGLSDTPAKLASEQLMQRYFRAARVVRQVNTILLQNLHARLFPIDTPPIRLSDDFVAIDELLHVTDEQLFEREPGAMLEAFLTMQRRRELKGMSARTLRALWRNRHRIDAGFRRNAANRARFAQMLREPRGLTHELRRMNLYDILGHYLPSFGRIVGQMQHDLFHVYTVDEHILMVIRNLRRFTETQHAHEYPLCSRLIADFDRKEVLYAAALFHDIAKGRGGDHSTLGARDATRFAHDHGFSAADGKLLAWLVEHHLTMSSTAQKQDISDPAVVEAFAGKIPSERALIALYLLTVADIRGTSPKVWNAWKAQLLEDLFHATRRVLAGEDAPRTLDDSLSERQRQAQSLLRLYAVPADSEWALWRRLDTAYFQRHSSEELAWHARHLYWRVDVGSPVVKARLSRSGAGLQLLVYLPDQPALFARICGFLGRAGLSILEAKIHTTRHGFALDSFMVHDPANPTASYRDTIQYIEHELTRVLDAQAPLELPGPGRVSRRVRHFPLTPEVRIFADDKGTHHILEIVAGDRPGLLARIAYVLAKANINVVSAKINTLGERAEDVFLVDGARLHDEHALLKLETSLYDELRV
ncbi:MAG TPA: [protein-PII] uridylyltransferase [Casimicrobiaceae bacterium]|nr:[protein-PII] uridylyltransferase [Casimicrobiaceae bacterium]